MRWIKVEISYREGDSLNNQWNAAELGDASMVLVVEDGAAMQVAVSDLGKLVQTTATELVQRSEKLIPFKAPEPASPDPELVPAF